MWGVCCTPHLGVWNAVRSHMPSAALRDSLIKVNLVCSVAGKFSDAFVFLVCLWCSMMWIQHRENWELRELSFFARGFWSCCRWMGGSHSPLASIRAEWGPMSQGGPPTTVHTSRDQITSDTICQWLLWGLAGPVQGWWLWRLEKTEATKCFLGLFPFRVARSLEP